MRKLAIVAAVAAGALAACGGAKQIGYIGASSGVKPNALKIVEVDAETGAIAVRGSLPVANATYIAVNRARTRLYTSLAAFYLVGAAVIAAARWRTFRRTC